MATKNHINELEQIIKKKSTYNLIYGKLSPQPGRVDRWILTVILIIFVANIFISDFSFLLMENVRVFYCGIILMLMYFLKNFIDTANSMNKEGFPDLNEKVKHEIYCKVRELKFDYEEVETLKTQFRNLSFDEKSNNFSWMIFLTISAIIIGGSISLYAIDPNDINIIKSGLSLVLILSAFWKFCRLIENEVFNRRSKRFYELYLILLNYRKVDLK